MNTYYNEVNMVIRPIRYRGPVYSEYMNDMMDEVYYNLAEILGYQRVDGTIAMSGVLGDTLNDINNEAEYTLGASASGISNSYVYSSGSIDDTINYYNSSYIHSIITTML